MKIIIGLGNTGTPYEKTRHNVGFMAVDFIRERFNFEEWHAEKKLGALVSKGLIENETVLLIKPVGFINESGRAVSKLLAYYKEDLSSLLIIHDDLDITSGEIRHTLSSRSAGHNGVQNIIDTLGTQDFARIRIGIGRPSEVLGHCEPSHDYVLKQFSPKEKEQFALTLEQVFGSPNFLYSL